MNETKLSPRQQKILDILSEIPLSGIEITQQLKTLYPVSKATLMRELAYLKNQRLVKSSGVGRKTAYISSENRLLKYVDLEAYFKDDSSLRKKGPKYFNFEVIDKFEGIFSDKEKQYLVSISKKLSDQKKTLDPSIFKREIERFTVEFSWKSSRIEGNTYSLLETEILIKQMKEAFGHTKYEALMILNHKRAIDYILENPKEFRALTIEKIFKLHHLLTKDLEISSGIRNSKVAITGTEYSPPGKAEDIKRALQKIVKIINKTNSPLAKTVIAALMIAYLQPFVDGNKRTSRTLANAILIAHDLFPISYRDLNEIEYTKSLLLFYETNNAYHFKRIFMNQFEFSVANYFQK